MGGVSEGKGAKATSDREVSFKPARDVRRMRWFWRSQLIMGAAWTVLGVWSMAGADTFPDVFAAGLATLGVVMFTVAALGRRARLQADAEGLRWQGVFRSTSFSWADVERLIVEDRGTPYGTKVDLVVLDRDGAKHNAPSDATAGLAEEKYADLRRQVLASIARCAEQAGVVVKAPGPDDPVVP